MSQKKYPITSAIRALRSASIEFEPCLYPYEERGGTASSARELGVAEHQVIKTLIMEDETKKALIVLMHGDKEVSTKNLARHLSCKSITPCAPQIADKHSGYQVGGTSPFGTRKKMPVYAQQSIHELDKIYLNGGKRGFLVCVDAKAALHALQAQLLEIAAE